MFKLSVYCRRTLNTIAPRRGAGPADPAAKPAAVRPAGPRARASLRPEGGAR